MLSDLYTPLVWVAALGLFGLGIRIGRKLTRPASADAIVGWREYWKAGPSRKYRRNQKTFQVFLGAFAGAVFAFGIRWLAEYLQSLALAIVAVAFGLLCIAIALGATFLSAVVRTD